MKAWRVLLCVFFITLCVIEVAFHRYDPKTALGCDALLLCFLAIKWGVDHFRSRRSRGDGPWGPPEQNPPPDSPVTANPRTPVGTAGGAAKMID